LKKILHHSNIPTERFTETVENYIKYRPSYPKEILSLLADECGLTQGKIIADIGSGTGLLTKLFLDNGYIVYGVEPNQLMRTTSENYLNSYSHFHSINGTAEATTLDNQSIDFITAGTAFHWFDIEKSHIEFKRILKKSGWVVLIWNVRNIEQSRLLREYEELIIKFGTDYEASNAKKFNHTVGREFFYPNEMKVKSFKNIQLFDWQGFKGRLLSASYALRPGDSGYDDMINQLKIIFDRYQTNSIIEFLYETKIYYGQLS